MTQNPSATTRTNLRWKWWLSNGSCSLTERTTRGSFFTTWCQLIIGNRLLHVLLWHIPKGFIRDKESKITYRTRCLCLVMDQPSFFSLTAWLQMKQHLYIGSEQPRGDQIFNTSPSWSNSITPQPMKMSLGTSQEDATGANQSCCWAQTDDLIPFNRPQMVSPYVGLKLTTLCQLPILNRRAVRILYKSTKIHIGTQDLDFQEVGHGGYFLISLRSSEANFPLFMSLTPMLKTSHSVRRACLMSLCFKVSNKQHSRSCTSFLKVRSDTSYLAFVVMLYHTILRRLQSLVLFPE